MDNGPHPTILAVLNFLAASIFLVGGLIVLVAGVIGGALFGAVAEGFWNGAGALGALGAVAAIFIGLFIALFGLLPLFTGIGLVKRRTWGRTLGFITAGLAALLSLGSLVGFDIVGTIIHGGYAVYAFWALTREEVAAEFATT